MRRRPEDEFDAAEVRRGAALLVAVLALTTFLASGCSSGTGGNDQGAEMPEPRRSAREQRDVPAPTAGTTGSGDAPQEEVGRTSSQAEEKARERAPEHPASPEEIQRYTRELAASIAADRAGAVRGDLLGSELVEHLHRTFRDVIEGPGGQEMLTSIQENNPGDLTLQVNSTYPEDAPVTTMPPRLLARFPPVPEGVEYRFVGCRLILLAREARVVLDYTERCFW